MLVVLLHSFISVANTVEIYEGFLFFYSCLWPCLHQKPCYWCWPWILHTQCSIHSSSSLQPLCKTCSCCSLTLMILNTKNSLAHHNPQPLIESSPPPPSLVGSENQDLVVGSCMSSNMETDPCSVSAQNQPTHTQTHHKHVLVSPL